MDQTKDMATSTNDAVAPEYATSDELAQLCDERQATYAMLARLFKSEVDEAYLAELRAARYPVSTGNEHADEGYRQLATALSQSQACTPINLARDYVRCFIGQGNNAFSSAYPFESVYRSEKRLLMQEPRDEVLAVYRSEGFDKDEEFKETEDHIGLELEFMGALCRRCADALRAGDEDEAVRLLGVQRNFAYDHLGSWLGDLAADMMRYAQTDFYKGLGNLALGFVEEDLVFLADAVGEGASRDDDSQADDAQADAGVSANANC